MMQAAPMLSAQGFAVRENRRNFLPEISGAKKNQLRSLTYEHHMVLAQEGVL